MRNKVTVLQLFVAATVIVFAHPLAAQIPTTADSAPNWSDSSASLSRAIMRFVRGTRFAGGVELGRALANATSESSGVVLDATNRAATTLSGSSEIEWRRFSLAGYGGISLSKNNRGGFGRLATSADLLTDRNGAPLWQIGLDYTGIQSPFVPGVISTGVSTRIGNPSLLEGVFRVGGRLRSSNYTPVTAIEVNRHVTHTAGPTLVSMQLSATGVFTKAPADRNPIVLEDVSNHKERISFGDLGLNINALRGNWIIGGRTTARVGRSAYVWDDPLPQMPVMRQGNGGHIGAIGRLSWIPIENLMMTVEGGRQLSEPLTGLAAVRYASASIRMNFEAGRRRTSAYTAQQIGHSSNLSLNSELVDGLAFREKEDNDGRRLLILNDVDGDVIEMVGDFVNWKPVRLRRCTAADAIATRDKRPVSNAATDTVPSGSQDNRWCGYFVLPTGVHHVLYRADGGEWLVPPGLAKVDDGFDGAVGLLIVP